ncbi:MAG: hypothetical protein IKB23_02540, partial [Clostridia bacterium]|nr:hypothetical protein [Clostridia bacterium]
MENMTPQADQMNETLAVETCPEETKPAKKKRFKEGRRIKTITPMSIFMPYVMRQRCDACNFISDEIDITAIEDYVFKKRAEGYKSFGIM